MILHGLFAQIVIDAEGLALPEDLGDFAVQRPGGLQIAAKRLFHDHPAPRSGVFMREALIAELADDLRDEPRQRGEIVKHITLRVVLTVEFAHSVFEADKVGGIVEVAHHVRSVVGDPVADLAFAGCACVLAQSLARALPEIFVGNFVLGETKYGELFGKQMRARQIEERGEQHTGGEIARGAEDDHDAAVGDTAGIAGFRISFLRHAFSFAGDCELSAQAGRVGFWQGVSGFGEFNRG